MEDAWKINVFDKTNKNNLKIYLQLLILKTKSKAMYEIFSSKLMKKKSKFKVTCCIVWFYLIKLNSILYFINWNQIKWKGFLVVEFLKSNISVFWSKEDDVV